MAILKNPATGTYSVVALADILDAIVNKGLNPVDNTLSIAGSQYDFTTLVEQNASTNAQTGTSYQPVITDIGKLVTLSNGSPIAVTIPSAATVAFPIGTQIDFLQIGAGKVTFAGAVSPDAVTINSLAGNLSASRWCKYSLVKTATNTWNLYGTTIA